MLTTAVHNLLRFLHYSDPPRTLLTGFWNWLCFQLQSWLFKMRLAQKSYIQCLWPLISSTRVVLKVDFIHLFVGKFNLVVSDKSEEISFYFWKSITNLRNTLQSFSIVIRHFWEKFFKCDLRCSISSELLFRSDFWKISNIKMEKMIKDDVK